MWKENVENNFTPEKNWGVLGEYGKIDILKSVTPKWLSSKLGE